MKAITLWQPWAQLIVLGEKKFETRSWSTNIRGRIAIHAAKREADSIMYREPFFESFKPYLIDNGTLPLGAVVGTVEITDCFRIVDDFDQLENGLIVTGKELAFGNYEIGRYAWQLDNPVMFDEPIPAKGSQGFWNWEG